MIRGRDVLLTEKRDHVYVLTLNREERRNALSEELFERLDEEWERFDEDEDLWAMIITGKGDVAFSAGHDLKEDVEGDVRGRPYAAGGTKRTPRRKAHPEVGSWKPTIAAVNGYAMAGGWQLAQKCDVRIAAEHATFGIPEVRWNLPAHFGTHLEHFPTMAIAAELLLWGRPVTAQRAYEIGFVNKVVPKERLLDEALEWADHVCRLGQESVRAHKKLLYLSRNMASQDIEVLWRDLFYWYPKKPGVVVDETEGPRAFVEKRAPRFFDLKRLTCRTCGSEYVVSKNGGGQPACCGTRLEQDRE
jgi:enoyl-CoA hydratase/carnithine racemase